MSLLDRVVVTTLPLVPKPVVRAVARRYLAGETIPEMIRTVSALNARGVVATVSVLGEHVTSRDEALDAVRRFVDVLGAIVERGLDANVSVKPTQIGLKIDPAFCEANLRAIIAAAEPHGRFVRIDMEDSSCTSDTLALFRAVRRDHEKVGTVLQAYLHRSADDATRLAGEGARIRICKGIYSEPASIAFHDREQIRDSFMRLVEILLRRRCYVAVATHDEALVEKSLALAASLGLGHDAYEFQMLLGVAEPLRARLVAAGHRVRVYVPFGPLWYPYSIRRLRENPRIARYVLEGIFRRQNGNGRTLL
jgi:proline dehydrogenase